MAKFVATLATAMSGAPGGIFAPSLSVGAGRINVISYGKERPIDPASNEIAWAKNRRAVTITID